MIELDVLAGHVSVLARRDGGSFPFSALVAAMIGGITWRLLHNRRAGQTASTRQRDQLLGACVLWGIASVFAAWATYAQCSPSHSHPGLQIGAFVLWGIFVIVSIWAELRGSRVISACLAQRSSARTMYGLLIFIQGTLGAVVCCAVLLATNWDKTLNNLATRLWPTLMLACVSFWLLCRVLRMLTNRAPIPRDTDEGFR